LEKERRILNSKNKKPARPLVAPAFYLKSSIRAVAYGGLFSGDYEKQKSVKVKEITKQ
jgi:hypothetical protein